MLKIACPCHQTALMEVFHVAFVGIRLPFETDVVISLLSMESVLNQPHQELNHIPQIEKHIGHFPLLTGVDELMVQLVRFHLSPPALHKNNAEKVEAVVSAKRNETVVDDFHGGKVSDFFPIMGVFLRCLSDESRFLCIFAKEIDDTYLKKVRTGMDYTKYFKKSGWAAAGRYYAMHPSKLKELFTSAKKYATKDGLKAVKDEFLFICQYIRDVFTGNYKEYNFLNLTVIVGALVYVVTPADVMPDFMPAIGLIDDAAILVWATHEFADELDRYRFFLSRRQREEDAKAAEAKALEIEDIDFEEIPPSQIG